MNQSTELRKEIAFYEKVMECSRRKLVKDSARAKKEEIEIKLNKVLTKK